MFWTNVQVLWGQPSISQELAGLRFDISARSFFQTNTAQAAQLSQMVVEAAGAVSLSERKFNPKLIVNCDLSTPRRTPFSDQHGGGGAAYEDGGRRSRCEYAEEARHSALWYTERRHLTSVVKKRMVCGCVSAYVIVFQCLAAGVQTSDTVLDLFCGAGFFALALATHCQTVHGFEVRVVMWLMPTELAPVLYFYEH